MDEGQVHRYRLDMDALMAELASILAERGYEVEQEASGVWRFGTRWGRGAAAGEVGSVLYSLAGHHLTESE